ncbi:MAG: hypothetical protein EB165_03535 [Euryarchaeota archaeon]|nr:hypothetical protein [Euryarchaeota archaeon]
MAARYTRCWDLCSFLANGELRPERSARAGMRQENFPPDLANLVKEAVLRLQHDGESSVEDAIKRVNTLMRLFWDDMAIVYQMMDEASSATYH